NAHAIGDGISNALGDLPATDIHGHSVRIMQFDPLLPERFRNGGWVEHDLADQNAATSPGDSPSHQQRGEQSVEKFYRDTVGGMHRGKESRTVGRKEGGARSFQADYRCVTNPR